MEARGEQGVLSTEWSETLDIMDDQLQRSGVYKEVKCYRTPKGDIFAWMYEDAERLRTCYIIHGGGQKIRQYAELGMPVPYIVEENDWASSSGVSGSDSYTGPIWAGSFEELKEMAEEWTDDEFDLVEDK